MRIFVRLPAACLLFTVGFAFFLAGGQLTPACTTAVISGSATADGRPLLWKNRDADDKQNQVVFCDDGKFPYIGVVNKGDASGMAIWAGINSKGFAIMNSASYNLDGEENATAEGNVMKLALQSCATLADFQALLERGNTGGRDVASNFGVIDAQGGAAYFETDKKSYKRFNATDPGIAPGGYIVRTNYSETGNPEKGTGFARFERASDLLAQTVDARSLTVQSLLGQVARDVANARIGSYPLDPRKKGAPAFAYTGDSVCRYGTSSVAVFQGVKPGEDPSLSVTWVTLGQPISGAAVPLWVAAGGVPKELAAGAEPAPLNVACDEVRDLLYPQRKGDWERYLSVEPLADPKRGMLPFLLAVEEANFKRAFEALEKWRLQAPSPETLSTFQNGLAQETLQGIRAILEVRRRDITAPPQPAPKKKQPKADSRGVSVNSLPK